LHGCHTEDIKPFRLGRCGQEIYGRIQTHVRPAGIIPQGGQSLFASHGAFHLQGGRQILPQPAVHPAAVFQLNIGNPPSLQLLQDLYRLLCRGQALHPLVLDAEGGFQLIHRPQKLQVEREALPRLQRLQPVFFSQILSVITGHPHIIGLRAVQKSVPQPQIPLIGDILDADKLAGVFHGADGYVLIRMGGKGRVHLVERAVGSRPVGMDGSQGRPVLENSQEAVVPVLHAKHRQAHLLDFGARALDLQGLVEAVDAAYIAGGGIFAAAELDEGPAAVRHQQIPALRGGTAAEMGQHRDFQGENTRRTGHLGHGHPDNQGFILQRVAQGDGEQLGLLAIGVRGLVVH